MVMFTSAASAIQTTFASMRCLRSRPTHTSQAPWFPSSTWSRSVDDTRVRHQTPCTVSHQPCHKTLRECEHTHHAPTVAPTHTSRCKRGHNSHTIQTHKHPRAFERTYLRRSRSQARRTLPAPHWRRHRASSARSQPGPFHPQPTQTPCFELVHVMSCHVERAQSKAQESNARRFRNPTTQHQTTSTTAAVPRCFCVQYATAPHVRLRQRYISARKAGWADTESNPVNRRAVITEFTKPPAARVSNSFTAVPEGPKDTQKREGRTKTKQNTQVHREATRER